MQDTGQLLKAVGLNDAESKLYLASVKLGPSTVIELAGEIGFARQTVYESLDTLQKKFLIATLEKGNKRYFVAEHPEKLRSFVERRENELRDLKQDLDRTIKNLELQMGGDKPVVHVFEGKEGIQAVLKDMQNDAPKDAVEITDVNAMLSVLSHEELTPIREEMIRKGVIVRGLYDGAKVMSNTKVERYALPKDFGNFKSNITIYGNKILMMTFEGKLNSVVIESPQLAKTLRILFDLSCMTAKNWTQENPEEKSEQKEAK